MIPFSLLLLTILIAIISIYILWRGIHLKVRNGWDLILTACSLAVFIYLYGAWLFASVYLKYIFASCFVIEFIILCLKRKSREVVSRSWLRRAFSLTVSIMLIGLNILYFRGTTGKSSTLSLSLPFKNGNYCVFQGGKGLPTNVFHYSYRGAVYAMDIVKLNSFGNRASSLFSKELTDYEIFGDTIYSPCAGKIADAFDEAKDNIPPNRTRGKMSTNRVLIEGDSFYVFIAHLKQHSLLVQVHDSVQVGEPLALAGNSGYSIEPHLHIQAHIKTNKALPWYKEKPLFIEFDGKSYLLFEQIHAKDK